MPHTMRNMRIIIRCQLKLVSNSLAFLYGGQQFLCQNSPTLHNLDKYRLSTPLQAPKNNPPTEFIVQYMHIYTVRFHTAT